MYNQDYKNIEDEIVGLINRRSYLAIRPWVLPFT